MEYSSKEAVVNFTKKVLVVAAHPDDEVLGCGGTISRITNNNGVVQCIFLSDGESSRYPVAEINSPQVKEKITSRQNSARLAATILGCLPPKFINFPDNKLDTIPLLEIAKIIQIEIDNFKPLLILTHFGSDLNIDHKITHDAVLIATRPNQVNPTAKIMSFEVPSSTELSSISTGFTFSPNCFFDVTGFEENKFRALSAYASEIRNFPHTRSKEYIHALMKVRGATVGINLCEAFVTLRELH